MITTLTITVEHPDDVPPRFVASQVNGTLRDRDRLIGWGSWTVSSPEPYGEPYCVCCADNECECEGQKTAIEPVTT